MPTGSNNFLQWNPNALNQDTDGEYLVETQRTDGAVSGLFPSKIANKLFYQCSMMAAGMGEMMKNKGFEMSDAVFADLITSLSHILTDAQFGSSAGTVCQGNDPRLDKELPTATKVWFWQNVAPTGWTIDATAADAVIAVKAGSGTYAVAGGSSAGTWTQPTHTHTVANHTHTVANHTHTISNHTHSFTGVDHLHSMQAHTHTVSNHTHTAPSHTHSFTGVDHTHATVNHTLTIAEIPPHAHEITQLVWRYPLADGNVAYGDRYHWNLPTNTGNTGGGQPHNHGNTGYSNQGLASTTVAGGALATSSAGAQTSSVPSSASTGAADRSLTGTTGGTGTISTNAGGAQTSSSDGAQTSSASATANTWRPLANVGIICTRNA